MQIYSMVYDANHGMLITGKWTRLMADKTHTLTFSVFFNQHLSTNQKKNRSRRGMNVLTVIHHSRYLIQLHSFLSFHGQVDKMCNCTCLKKPGQCAKSLSQGRWPWVKQEVVCDVLLHQRQNQLCFDSQELKQEPSLSGYTSFNVPFIL